MSKGKLHPFFSDEKILDVIRDYSNDTIYFKDHQSRFIWNNRSHAAQFGISDPREMVGKTDADYFPKDFATRARKEEMEIMETRIPLISNIEKLEKPDGSVVWYSASKYPIIDEKDNVIGTWGISRNITALKIVEEELSRTNEKLKRLSQVDDLTGLFNRRYFYDYVEDHFDEPKHLVELDVDDFKVFNDRFGHQVGDEVLLAFSRTMEQAFKHGFVSRFGGDEFIALFCGDVTREQVRQAISKFQHLLKEKSLTLQTGRVNASIGIAYDSTGVVPIDDLYQRADQALYAAKRQGKNCAVEWSPELKKELNDIAEGKESGK